MTPYRVAMFDLDGTLAASKSDISPSTAHMLCVLLSTVDVCIISGGRFEQFDAQVLRHLDKSCDLARLHLMPTGHGICDGMEAAGPRCTSRSCHPMRRIAHSTC